MSGHSVTEAELLRRTGRRLGRQAAVIVSVIVVLLTGTAVLVVLHGQHAAADALLSESLTRADDLGDPPEGVWLADLGPDGAVHATPGIPPGLPVEDALRRTAVTGRPAAFEARVGGGEFRVQTEHRPDGATYAAALDLRANHTDRDWLLVSMLSAGAIGLLLAAAAGAWLGRRATRPLATALVRQRRFVGDASHELRTPLTLLGTRAQLLRRRLRGESAAPELLAETDRLVADVDRLAAILDDLLVAADPGAAHLTEQVDLVGLATDVVAEATPAAAARHIRLTGPAEHNPANTGDTTVAGSTTALRRAITALVDNAVRHAHHQVEVTVLPGRRCVVVDVVDDGPGMDPLHAPRMWERFVSTGTTDADGRRHYGLGLALVSDITARHRGRVELTDHNSAATTFRITLPTTAPCRSAIPRRSCNGR